MVISPYSVYSNAFMIRQTPPVKFGKDQAGFELPIIGLAIISPVEHSGLRQEVNLHSQQGEAVKLLGIFVSAAQHEHNQLIFQDNTITVKATGDPRALLKLANGERTDLAMIELEITSIPDDIYGLLRNGQLNIESSGAGDSIILCKQS